MAVDFSIVIATFGELKWKDQALDRAIPSAKSFNIPVYYNHEKTLHEARNAGLAQVKTEFVCHLDADDELESGFFDHISKVGGDLRPPSIRYVPSDVAEMPKVAGHSHNCMAECLEFGNWMVVGTVARTQLLKDVGWWKDCETFEDWELWMRCWLAGAKITPVPDAVYRAYSTPQGRCRNRSQKEINRICREIQKANLPHKYR